MKHLHTKAIEWLKNCIKALVTSLFKTLVKAQGIVPMPNTRRLGQGETKV